MQACLHDDLNSFSKYELQSAVLCFLTDRWICHSVFVAAWYDASNARHVSGNKTRSIDSVNIVLDCSRVSDS